MKIWELSTLEIGYTSYYLPEEGKADSFIELANTLGDENKTVSEKWEQLVLLKSEQRIDPDFFDIYDCGVLIVSKKASLMLKSFFKEDEIELLPFLNDEDEFFLFRLLKFTDCLDKESSIFEIFDSGQISDYEFLAFDYDKIISSTPIFKIPELPYTIFVTHAFKYFYDELGLKGIDFDDDSVIFTD
ncbi:hypothetical protein FACS189420_8380 [Bacteroidia bacterium]|nr:hypothetical protein FACS189420_8380 [Bacteroidia bacterium]